MKKILNSKKISKKNLNIFSREVKIINFDSEYFIFYLGNINEKKNEIKNKLRKILKNNKIKNLSDLDGQYLIFIFNLKNKKLLICNSNLSYYNLFYKEEKGAVFISEKLLYLKSKTSKINIQNVYEWLMLSGRSLTNETKLENIFYLLPGETLIVENNTILLINKKYYLYKPTSKINVIQVSNILKKYINNHLKKKKKVLMGLTGGIDSRILACCINKENKKKIISYTYGNGYNFEKLIANIVSKKCNFFKHLDINLQDQQYFPKKNQSLYESNLNSTFQHHYQIDMFKKISRITKTNDVILGCGLDQFLGSSFSEKDLYKLKTKKEFIKWFEKKYYLFSFKEINSLLKINDNKYKNKMRENLEKTISKFEYKNFVDLNDMLQFEIRILRWYNRNLVYILKNLNLIAPTYGKKFINLAFKVSSKLRNDSLFRKQLLKYLNKDLSDLVDSNDMLPANYNGKLTDVFKKKLGDFDNIAKTENLKKNSNIKSLSYDVNFGFKFANSKPFFVYLNSLLNKMSYKKDTVNFIKKIIKNNKEDKNDFVKKIIFSISYLEILKTINE